jgi:hypothetical protein
VDSDDCGAGGGVSDMSLAMIRPKLWYIADSCSVSNDGFLIVSRAFCLQVPGIHQSTKLFKSIVQMFKQMSLPLADKTLIKKSKILR